jgi:hypothetical protein
MHSTIALGSSPSGSGIGGCRPSAGTSVKDPDEQRFVGLVRRFNQLGCMLPNEADIRAEDNEQTIAAGQSAARRNGCGQGPD